MGVAQDSRGNLRVPGREHIPVYPSNWFIIRIVQGVLAVVILGLTANALSYYNNPSDESLQNAAGSFTGYSGYSGGYDLDDIADALGWRAKRSVIEPRATLKSTIIPDSINFMLATSILTFLWAIYNGVWEFVLPVIYNYWGVLFFEVLFVILWLAAFALTFDEHSDILKNNYIGKLPNGKTKNAYGGIVAAAAFGIVEFLLFGATLAVHSMRLHYHRQAGLHCVPLSMVRSAPATAPVPAPVPQTYPVYAQPQPQQQQPQTVYVPAPTPSPAPVQQQMPYQPPQQGFYSPSPPPQH